jgi:hypothetical protein
MKTASTDFAIREGGAVDLKKWLMLFDPLYRSKKHYQELLIGQVARLSTLQLLFCVSNSHAILLIFQPREVKRGCAGARRP